jgi:hypothetical protein
MTNDIFECVDPNGVPFSKTKNFVDKKWAMKKIAALEEENARLRKALKPFAAPVKDFRHSVPDRLVVEEEFTLGQLRAAAAAIREGGGDE